ncbi:hypothetical protein MLD38_021329 [Melastoma candidum]|uniref:Uncharacterized protein n=1 Tax=Melastoma candidum TaxID=119954 RepID=A0ACB9QFR6_9MYRT|nr:hypothetical protein MLD38_021329 [Melastoma candidum]
MFVRLTEITNVMDSRGKTISNSELVRKILRALTKSWEAKKTTIEEANDLTSLSLQQLLGSLVDENESKFAEEKKYYAIAFKGSVDTSDEFEDESSSDSDNEISLIARIFKKYLRKNRFKRKRDAN